MAARPTRFIVTALGIAVAILGAVAVPRGAAQSGAAGDAPLAGRTMLDKLSSVGQFDALEATTADSLRSASAACLSAYLLMGGDFARIAREHDVPTKLTADHLHRLQDVLYRAAARDTVPGIRASAEANYDSSDTYVDWSMRGDDELHLLMQALDLSSERLYGPTRATADRKSDAVMAKLVDDTTAVFLVGLLLDPDSRTLHSLPRDTEPDHWVIVFWADNGFQVLDSWRQPGERTRLSWSDETATDMLLDTRNVVYALTRRR
ncbi:MAG: hypothetical protein RL760_877 [Candidatus Eisenbacteria bacterium]